MNILGAPAGPRLLFDRVVSASFLPLLEKSGLLTGLVRLAQSRSDLLDVQLRKSPTGQSSASLYVGLSAVLTVVEVNGRLRLNTHPTYADRDNWKEEWRSARTAVEMTAEVDGVLAFAEDVITAVRPAFTHSEGRVHAALCADSFDAFSVLDREASMGFADSLTRTDVWGEIRTRFLTSVLAGGEEPWRAKAPTLGTGADLLAVDQLGRLLVIEVKPVTSGSSISWAAAQASVYTTLFRLWIAQDPHQAVATLNAMLAQRIQLGLCAPRGFAVGLPVQTVPVVAVGGRVKSAEVRRRFNDIQRAIVAGGSGGESLEVWEVEGNDRLVSIGGFSDLALRAERAR